MIKLETLNGETYQCIHVNKDDTHCLEEISPGNILISLMRQNKK